ncbi:MAG: hypothetical protein U1E13_02830, partial [Methylophilaceae bacterium]|nr:hypothetical protein [Methylophilaceae bacterium]
QIDGTTTTTTDSRAYSTGNALAVAWHPSGNYLAVAKTLLTGDTPYYVLVYEFNSTTSTLGNVVARSAATTLLNIQPKALDWDPTGNYLAVGRSTSTYMTILKFVPNAGDPNAGFPQITPSTTTATPGTVSSLRWHPTLPNFIGIATSPTTNANKIRVLQFDPITPAVTNYALAAEPNTQASVDWSACGNNLSAVRAATTLNHRLYTFTQSPPTLVESTQFATVGATLAETRFDPSGIYCIDAATNGYVARRTLSADNIFTDLTLYLNNDLIIQNCWLILSGNCSIVGNNKHLSLARTCTLQIAPQSTLQLKNITIEGLSNRRIVCTQDSSMLALNNATLHLNGDYSFATGGLAIRNKVQLIGNGHTFIYTTNQPCTIAAKSTLTLDTNLTLSYAPQNASATL